MIYQRQVVRYNMSAMHGLTSLSLNMNIAHDWRRAVACYCSGLSISEKHIFSLFTRLYTLNRLYAPAWISLNLVGIVGFNELGRTNLKCVLYTSSLIVKQYVKLNDYEKLPVDYTLTLTPEIKRTCCCNNGSDFL